MELNILVNPAGTIPWLTPREREANVMLLDFDADVEESDILRIDLNVVFNPKSVRRGAINRVDYYVGSTGAEISVEACGGKVRSYTQAVTLTINYKNIVEKEREAALNLSPSASVGANGATASVSAGAITRQAKDKVSFTTEFASEERYLAPVLTGDTIKWVVTLPRGEGAIRDFLIGNLYLFASCEWSNGKRTGTVSVRPSDVRCFGSDRRPISKLRSLLMLFVLWSKYQALKNRDGFKISFEEVSNGTE